VSGGIRLRPALSGLVVTGFVTGPSHPFSRSCETHGAEEHITARRNRGALVGARTTRTITAYTPRWQSCKHQPPNIPQ
jgi:hypothetical protein